MIGTKLESGHLHIQILAIMRISRTVQWMREAAQRDATFVRRALEETALTTIYLVTFTYWMRDESENSQRTRDFLEQKLQMAETLDRLIYRTPRTDTTSDSSAETSTTHEIPAAVEYSPLTESITPKMHAKSG